MADLFSSSATPGLKRAAEEIAAARRPPSVPIRTFYELDRIVERAMQQLRCPPPEAEVSKVRRRPACTIADRVNEGAVLFAEVLHHFVGDALVYFF